MSDNIKRYELFHHHDRSQGGNHVDLEEMPLGRWVKHEDHAPIRAYLERVLEALGVGGSLEIASCETGVNTAKQLIDNLNAAIEREKALARERDSFADACIEVVKEWVDDVSYGHISAAIRSRLAGGHHET